MGLNSAVQWLTYIWTSHRKKKSTIRTHHLERLRMRKLFVCRLITGKWQDDKVIQPLKSPRQEQGEIFQQALGSACAMYHVPARPHQELTYSYSHSCLRNVHSACNSCSERL